MRKKIELSYADGTSGNAELERLMPLGEGLLSNVYLVRDNGNGKLYAEKVFRKKGSVKAAISSGLYRLFFQAPSPYQTSEDAARAALHRRNIVKDLSLFWFSYPAVSGGLYTRWDEDSKSNVLGTEYIQGRPPMRGEANRKLFRQWTHNSVGRIYCSLAGGDFCRMEGSAWEIDDLTKHMKLQGEKFGESGFIGSQWQVDPSISVTSKNYVRREEDSRWVLVDMESGAPALAHPRYIWKGIASGRFPLYDDVDFETLEKYLMDNEDSISERFGPEFMDGLHENAEKLEYHTEKWKDNEAAIFRNKHKIFADPEMRREARKRWAEHWKKEGSIDSKLASEIEQSDMSFLNHLSYDTVESALSGLGYAWDSIAENAQSLYRITKGAPRILYSAFFDEKYLQKKTEEYIDREVEKWLDRGWLSHEESTMISSQMKSDKWLKEHVKGTVAYIDLNLLGLPIIGDLLLGGLAAYTGNMQWLIPMGISPALRGVYTATRMVKNKAVLPYIVPFFGGLMPKVGMFAFPAQLAIHSLAAEPESNTFISQYLASKVGSHFPIYGGEDSILEHKAMKAAGIPASINYEIQAIKKAKKNRP